MKRPDHEKVNDRTDRSAGPTACHPWRGNVNHFGTPSIVLGKGTRSARRVWWEHVYGPVPPLRLIFMKCGNKQCINERHMELRPRKDPEVRFWSKVTKHPGDGCWIWTGYRNDRGYGQFMPTWKTITTAHRYSYELVNGDGSAEGLVICHRCDTPACVRPDHLFAGTFMDNTRDMIAKGRHSHGEKHSQIMREAFARRKARLASERQREEKT